MTPALAAPDHGRTAKYTAEAQLARLFDRATNSPTVVIAGSTVTLPVERRFANIDSIQRYVDAVLKLPWVTAQWPDSADTPPRVRERRGTTKAHYDYQERVIAIPVAGPDARWALRELVVLHEVAHHLGNGSVPDTGHGGEFTERFIALLEGVIGPEAGWIMRILLADQG